jgi:hypothetical protein
LKISLVSRAYQLPTRQVQLTAYRQELYQSLGDRQIIRWLRPTDRQPSDHWRERFSRDGLRQSGKPGGLFPGIDVKSR